MSEPVKKETLVPGSRPLVTFALAAYNQEKYVREAVEGALAQTYSPLEIILSDDCSSDQTFEIMQSMAKEYNGPHVIKLNRNKINVGIVRHVEKIDRMAKGELIVHAAGDDVSLSERVEKTCGEWLLSPERPSLIVSNGKCIDDEGKDLEAYFLNKRDRQYYKPFENIDIPVWGASMVIDAGLIAAFPIATNVYIAEDVILQRRANLLNGILYIPDVLVKYRVHAGSLFRSDSRSKTDHLSWADRWAKERFYGYEQYLRDINLINPPNKKKLTIVIEADMKIELKKINLLKKGFIGSLNVVLQVCLDGSVSWMKKKSIIKLFLLKWTPWYLNWFYNY